MAWPGVITGYGRRRTSARHRASGAFKDISDVHTPNEWLDGAGSGKDFYLKISDPFALAWFAGWSAAAFLFFGYDKWRAGRNGARVPESTLALLGALGGWPGGLLGMICFRHKTAKWTFWFKYAVAFVLFAAEVWAWWHWR
jgi:uncharacterized membrane protein YsdA (DUF1294 family)